MAKITITITITDPTNPEDRIPAALEYLRQDAQSYFDGSAVELTYTRAPLWRREGS